MGREEENKYHREYYRKNSKYRKKMRELDNLNRVRKIVERLKDYIQVREAKKIGHGSHVMLPYDWRGKTVVIIDNKFFMDDIVRKRKVK
jgi:hypothetical protein